MIFIVLPHFPWLKEAFQRHWSNPNSQLWWPCNTTISDQYFCTKHSKLNISAQRRRKNNPEWRHLGKVKIFTSAKFFQTNLRWDPTYLRAIPGLLKLAGIALSLVCDYITNGCFNLYFLLNKFPGVLCLRHGSAPSFEGTTSGRVVYFHCHDSILGFPCIIGNAYDDRW